MLFIVEVLPRQAMKRYTVILSSLNADAPAKELVRQIKLHMGIMVICNAP